MERTQYEAIKYKKLWNQTFSIQMLVLPRISSVTSAKLLICKMGVTFSYGTYVGYRNTYTVILEQYLAQNKLLCHR